jgi:hypothetical protein
MDVFYLIKQHLDAVACPVYDPGRDGRALAVALGLRGVPWPRHPGLRGQPASYCAQEAQQQLGTERFCGAVWWSQIFLKARLPVVGRTAKGLPRFDGHAVRTAVLEAHGGAPAAWVCAAVGLGCEPWFAHSMLPLPTDPSEWRSMLPAIRVFWQAVRKYRGAQRQQLLHGVIAHRIRTRVMDQPRSFVGRDARRLLEAECDAALASTAAAVTDLLVDALVGGTWGASPSLQRQREAYEDLLNSKAVGPLVAGGWSARLGALDRARALELGSGGGTRFAGSPLARRVVRHVVSGDEGVEELREELEAAWKEGVEAVAREVGIVDGGYESDEYYLSNEDEHGRLFTLKLRIEQREKQLVLEEKFAACGLRIGAFARRPDADGCPIPTRVSHPQLGVHSDDVVGVYELCGLKDNERRWNDNEMWGHAQRNSWCEGTVQSHAERFRRYARLRDALGPEGLPDPWEESRLCADFVVHGTYNGPVSDGSASRKGETKEDRALRLAAAMVKEMHFLDTETDYEEILEQSWNVLAPERAKLLAVREFINEDGRAGMSARLALLPPRLRQLAGTIGTLTQAEKACVRHCVEEEEEEDSEASDSDSDDD